MTEAHLSESSISPTPFEVGHEQLAVILAPDELLAAQSLDRSILVAEADPQIDPDALTLLQFQRSMVDMEPRDAYFAALRFARATGKYASFHDRTDNAELVGLPQQGDSPTPDLHYPLMPGFFVIDLANGERWRAVGIEPKEYYGDNEYGNSYKNSVEGSWRAAREARTALIAAQAADEEVMMQVLNPPAFEPRS